MPKIKIISAGQPCRHCNTPVVKRTHKPNEIAYRKKPYWFEWWFACPNPSCKTLYMVEEAKRYRADEPQMSLFGGME